MSFWNFLGRIALFNAIREMFSSKRKHKYVPAQQLFQDYVHDDHLELEAAGSDINALLNKLDELESRLDETDEMSDHYDELQDQIDELQDRIDSLEEYEEIQDELDDLRDELDDLYLDRNLYDDPDNW